MNTRRAQPFWVYVGTYTSEGSKGIHLLSFDPESGSLRRVGLAAEAPNPTFLAVHPQKGVLYAGSELRDAGGRHGGSLNAFAIDARTGGLRFLNRQPSRGDGPCHLSVEASGRFVLTANYASGSVAMLPVEADGRLGEPADGVQHEGSSVNRERQSGPHAHSITPSPDNRFALAADLGTDRIMVYRLDLAAGRLRPNDPPWTPVRPGAGPRHLVFHPERPMVYAINELDNTVVSFAWDAGRGALREIQTVSTLPAGFRETNYAADIHTDAAGRFLYGSNRGHDSIAVFGIGADGLLTPLGHASVGGRWPRHFALDSSGAWLLAANQESDAVTVLRRDPDTGNLQATRQSVEASKAVCVALVRAS